MSGQAYVGTTKRTFQQAVVHLLESGYRLVGSRRVLELLASDLQQLVDTFYPAPERLSSGWMVFTGTKASGHKASPGQSAADHDLVTLAWPVVLPEDVEQMASWPSGPEQKEARRKWYGRRLARIVEYGQSHPGGPVLLTLADLSAMTGLTTVMVSQILAEVREEIGKALPLKGYYFDQGVRPTHKAEIVAQYESGVDEADIARQAGHAQTSVGHYLRDYERVKLMMAHGTPVDQIDLLLGMQPSVVRAYVGMVEQYHPELASEKCITASQT
ncbi:MAG: DUF1670 domain-containing protein [Anaerolineae bacterium]|jgi:DNA-binding CsgD family transcriptional regulator